MIDCHCHLDLYPDPASVVDQCVRRRLYVLSVTTLPSAFVTTAALAPADSRIRTALGLHPELAATRAGELPLFEQLLPRTRYVGEVGLDGSREHRSSLNTQLSIFREILRLCACAGGKILSLHSRGATGAILDALAAAPTAGEPILHWYLGSPKQIARAVEMGCWFSIGPSMLSSGRGRAAVREMPLERILPETDGPFGLSEGRPALPWHSWSTIPALAEIWQQPSGEIEKRLRSNFRSLLTSAGYANRP